MTVELPGLLRALRQSRSISISDVARRTGLARKTITRWEAGEFKPRLAELDALLDALQATDQERQHCLELLAVPRALQRLQASSAQSHSSLAGIHYGDLLRALRSRKGWTQEQTASALHVAQSTVARWERNELHPDEEMAPQLCRVLGALEEERAALADWGRRFSALGYGPADENDPDALETYFARLRSQLQEPSHYSLSDLYYAALISRHRHSAEKTERGRHLISDLSMLQANFSSEQWRAEQAGQRALWALQYLPPGSKVSNEFRLRAELFGVIGRYPLKRHARLLAHWLDTPLDAAHRSWLLGQISSSLVDNGALEQAIACGEASCKLVLHWSDPMEYIRRRNDLAHLYLSAGQPQRAIETATPTESLSLLNRLRAELTLAEANRSLGNRSAAHDNLTAAIKHHSRLHIPYYAQVIETLRTQF